MALDAPLQMETAIGGTVTAPFASDPFEDAKLSLRAAAD